MKKYLFLIFISLVYFGSFATAKASSQFDQLTFDGTVNVNNSNRNTFVILTTPSNGIVTNVTLRGHAQPYSDVCTSGNIFPALFLTIASDGDTPQTAKVWFRKENDDHLGVDDQDVIFDISDLNLTFNDINGKEFIVQEYPSRSAPYPVGYNCALGQNGNFANAFAFAGQNDTNTSESTFVYGDTTRKFYLRFNYTPVPPLTFSNLTDGQYINPNPNFHLKGTCPVVGANQLAITQDITNQQLTLQFIYECKSDNTFDIPYPMNQYTKRVYVVNKSDGSFKLVSFNVTDQTSSILEIVYPVDDGSHNISIQPSTSSKVRFHYTFNPLYETSTFNGGIGLEMDSCTDNGYQSCSQMNVSNMGTLDTDSTGYFLYGFSINNTQTTYYKAQLLGQLAGQSSQQTLYVLNFSITGDASSTNQTVPPDLRDIGYCIKLLNFCPGNMIRDLFVPSYGIINGVINTVSAQMQSKIPFAYYYNLKDQLAGGTASSTDFSYNIPITLASSTGISLSIPFGTSAATHSVRNTIEPWFNAFAWFGFAWWLYHKATRFNF